MEIEPSIHGQSKEFHLVVTCLGWLLLKVSFTLFLHLESFFLLTVYIKYRAEDNSRNPYRRLTQLLDSLVPSRKHLPSSSRTTCNRGPPLPSFSPRVDQERRPGQCGRSCLEGKENFGDERKGGSFSQFCTWWK